MGDTIACDFTIGDGCTAVLTTQASTKVYKSVQSKCSEQILKAEIGRGALLAVIPDPVTCFSTAKYLQKQVFNVASDSNLLIVDWITCGRHPSGEKWDFELYKSTNQIYIDGDQPLFLDSILLEQGSTSSISERMQDYQVLAMVVILGPKLQPLQNEIQQNVKKIMSDKLRMPSSALRRYGQNHASPSLTKPDFIVSSSVFGPKGVGVVVRIAAMTTESVYRFLYEQLISLEPLLGVSPYHKHDLSRNLYLVESHHRISRSEHGLRLVVRFNHIKMDNQVKPEPDQYSKVKMCYSVNFTFKNTQFSISLSARYMTLVQLRSSFPWTT